MEKGDVKWYDDGMELTCAATPSLAGGKRELGVVCCKESAWISRVEQREVRWHDDGGETNYCTI